MLRLKASRHLRRLRLKEARLKAWIARRLRLLLRLKDTLLLLLHHHHLLLHLLHLLLHLRLRLLHLLLLHLLLHLRLKASLRMLRLPHADTESKSEGNSW